MNDKAQCYCDPKTHFHNNEYFLPHRKLLSNNWGIFISDLYWCLQTLSLNDFLNFIYNCLNETSLKLLGSLCFAFSHCFNSECHYTHVFDPKMCMKWVYADVFDPNMFMKWMYAHVFYEMCVCSCVCFWYAYEMSVWSCVWS